MLPEREQPKTKRERQQSINLLHLSEDEEDQKPAYVDLLNLESEYAISNFDLLSGPSTTHQQEVSQFEKELQMLFQNSETNYITTSTSDLAALNLNPGSSPRMLEPDLLWGFSSSSGTKAHGFPRNASAPNLASDDKSTDPFADLVWDSLEETTRRPTVTCGGSPSHRPSTPLGYKEVQSPLKPSLFGTPKESPTKPDYSRSHFDAVVTPEKPAGVRPKLEEDAFGDLLGSPGFEFTPSKSSGPTSMNEMRKEQLVKEMDPEKVKIMEWTEGKRRNIRALLCSLHTVVWSDSKWSECGMHQLVSHSDVKKMYRRACLAVHPDKQMGTENEGRAKMIFMELNVAWNEFQTESGS